MVLRRAERLSIYRLHGAVLQSVRLLKLLLLMCLLQSPLPAESRPAVSRASCSCATPLPETGRPALPTRSQRPSSLGAISRDVLDVLFDEPDISEGALMCRFLWHTTQFLLCSGLLASVAYALTVLLDKMHL